MTVDSFAKRGVTVGFAIFGTYPATPKIAVYQGF
ncbi:hypothetical protein FMEAI12_5270021 [Parafrankia sp. Ea1.12]|nr:hypothetical protein FMEAI12_5270021 [Parafrankia sp. Ea1.12]